MNWKYKNHKHNTTAVVVLMVVFQEKKTAFLMTSWFNILVETS